MPIRITYPNGAIINNSLATSKKHSKNSVVYVHTPLTINELVSQIPKISLWTPTNTKEGSWFGGYGSTEGNYEYVISNAYSRYTALNKARFSNIENKSNQLLGVKQLSNNLFRKGGYSYSSCAGLSSWSNGAMFFAGLAPHSFITGSDIIHCPNIIGFYVGSKDNRRISIISTDEKGNIYKVYTGANLEIDNGYEFSIECPPASKEYLWKLVNINTKHRVTGWVINNLPSNTKFVSATVIASNHKIKEANTIQLDVNSLYTKLN